MRRVLALSACAVTALASLAMVSTSSGAANGPYLATYDGALTTSVPNVQQLQPVAIRATGFPAGSQVFVEQCDGVDPTSIGWDATIDCDLGSSPAPAIADSSGKVFFDPTDANHAFRPFTGASPQGLFNCLGPTPASPVNGLTDYRNCKIRVSTSNQIATADQQFITNLTLPDPITGVVCNVNVTLTPTKPFTQIAQRADAHLKGGTAVGVPNAPCLGPKVNVNPKKGAIAAASIKFGKTTVFAQNTSCSSIDGTFTGWSSFKVQVKLLNAAGKPVVVAPSTVDFNAVNPTADFAGAEGFWLALTSKKGDRLRLVLHSTATLAQLQAACAGPGGLASLPFTGTIELF